VTFWEVPPDASGTIAFDGVPVTIGNTVPGQNFQLTFDGIQDMNVSLLFDSPSCGFCDLDVTIYKPDQSVWLSFRYGGGAPGYRESLRLPATGSYRAYFHFVIQPLGGGSVGTTRVTFWEVPPDATGTIAFDGVPVTIGNTVPGQGFQLMFDGTVNQKVSMRFENPSCGFCEVDVTIYKPDQSVWLGFRYGGGQGAYREALLLPATGGYRAYFHYVATTLGGGPVGTTRVTFWEIPPDASGTIAFNGVPVTIGNTVPGQNFQLTFDGTLNQKVSLFFENPSCGFCTVQVTVYKPDQSVFTAFGYGGGVGYFLDARVLPATGSYRIYFHYDVGAVGTTRVTGWDDTNDVTASVTINGPAAQLDTVPGQDARVTFTATAGQQVVLHKTANYCCAATTLKDSTGATLYGPNGNQNFDSPTITLNGNSPFTVYLVHQGSPSGHSTVSVTTVGGGGGGVGGGGSGPRPPASAPREDSPPTQPAPSTQPPPPAQANAEPGPPSDTQPPPAPATVPPPAKAPETPPMATPAPPGEDPLPDDVDVVDDPELPPGQPAVGEGTAAPRAPPALAAVGTAISGQVRRLDGSPLPHVTLAVGNQRTQTGPDGRFLLPIQYTQPHVNLVIDGRTATRQGRSFGVYEVGGNVAEGRATELPYIVWMTKIDWRNSVHFESPTRHEVVITTPRIPGFELHLPAGSVIKDMDGNVITELSITPIPVDKPPFPLPGPFPMYFTVQPGCAWIAPRGAFFVYPNTGGSAPGSGFNAWAYEPDRGWYTYGRFRVSPDGKKVLPEPGAEVYEFDGASILPGLLAALLGWLRDLAKWATGDPVDPGTGLFDFSRTDLSLPDAMPVDATRTYRQLDDVPRGFGRGSGLSYQMGLNFTDDWSYIDLVFSDSSKIRFLHITGSLHDGIFENQNTPGEFYKARLEFNGWGFDLTRTDGTTLMFGNPAFLYLIRDRNNNQISITRSLSRPQDILQLTSSNGRWIRFSYEGTTGRINQAWDNLGRTVTYQYDAQGRLWKVTDPEQGVQEYTYEGTLNRMSTLKDARAIVFLTNEYNVGGVLDGTIKKQTQADQTTFQYTYTVQGNKIVRTEVTDPRSTITRFDFNSDGYVTTVTEALSQPEAQVTQIQRATGTNRVLSVTDQLGRKTSFGYDAAGGVTSVTRLADTPDAVTTVIDRQPDFDLIKKVTDPLMHAIQFDYDALGNLKVLTDALLKQTTYDYNAAGQLTKVTDPLGHHTDLGYQLGDLVSITDHLGNQSKRFTDGGGRILVATDPLGNSVVSTYDRLNQVKTATDSLGHQTQFNYDPNGNLLWIKDARQKQTSFSYSPMDRVQTRTDPLQRQDVFNLYDENGNLKKVTDRRGLVTTYRYDRLDRLNFVGFNTQGPDGNPTYDSTISYTWDGGDRLRTVVDSLAGTITLTPDSLDRIQSEATPQGTVSYGYDAADRRTRMSVPGQPDTTYGYYDNNLPQTITRGTETVTFTYDDASRPLTAAIGSQISASYAFDDANRLVGISYLRGVTPIGDVNYEYDRTGQRTNVSGSLATVNLPQPITSATYNDANRLTSWNGYSGFQYDNAGNLTHDQNYDYVWDSRGQLASLTGSGLSASFSHDGVGRRIRKTVAGFTTRFLYDGASAIQEQNGSGQPAFDYLSGQGADSWLTRIPADGSARQHYLRDGLGSTVALTDDSGAITTNYGYEPFGRSSQTGSSSTNSYQWTGREVDGTGLQYNRARYYDPNTQRWISEDPIGFGGGNENLYEYAGSNPVDYADPSGLILPMLAMECAIGAISNLVDDRLSGRKIAWDQRTLASAASGCVMGMAFGLIGAGIGLLAGRLLFGLLRSAALRGAAKALPDALRYGKNAERGLHVYVGIRNGIAVYAGITNNIARRAAQHGARFDRLEQLTPGNGVTRGEGRAIEQALIVRNPGFGNVRNSISPSHSYYDEAVEWGEAWLRAHGY
jgi:RHS repeat-associated protein